MVVQLVHPVVAIYPVQGLLDHGPGTLVMAQRSVQASPSERTELALSHPFQLIPLLWRSVPMLVQAQQKEASAAKPLRQAQDPDGLDQVVKLVRARQWGLASQWVKMVLALMPSPWILWQRTGQKVPDVVVQHQTGHLNLLAREPVRSEMAHPSALASLLETMVPKQSDRPSLALQNTVQMPSGVRRQWVRPPSPHPGMLGTARQLARASPWARREAQDPTLGASAGAL